MEYLTLNLTQSKLEKDILNLYKDGKPFRYQMEYKREGLGALLDRRKELLDSEMLDSIRNHDYCGILSNVEEFNERLLEFRNKVCNQVEQIIDYIAEQVWRVNYEGPAFEMTFYLEDCPEEMTQRNQYGESIWDILNNHEYHPKYKEGFYKKCFFGGTHYQADTTDINYLPKKELTKELVNRYQKLSWPFIYLLDNTYFALQDFLFCKKFRVEMNVHNCVEFSS